MAYWRYEYYEPSRPREVKGGIKAQSQRGAFGPSWWAKRWIDVLEGFDIGARLGRGRSYARRGQVLSIDIEQGTVKAEVQGSRPRPYQVDIKVKTLAREDWSRLAQRLAARAIFSAKLLAGEMPENVEDAFKDSGLSLFPNTEGDLETECSCPDWTNPCKHVAAVYYILGEEFDRDPFLIFKLRGIGREELTGLMGSQPGAGLFTQPEDEPPPPPEPLPVDPQAFWGSAAPEHERRDEVFIPAVSAALPKRLGNFPLWRGKERFLSVMENVYRQASSTGLNVFLGEYPMKKEQRRGSSPGGTSRQSHVGINEGRPTAELSPPVRKRKHQRRRNAPRYS
jgi:uncharacterized Zn finger protein